MFLEHVRRRLHYHIVRPTHEGPKSKSTVIDSLCRNDTPSSTTQVHAAEKGRKKFSRTTLWDWRSNVKLALAVSILVSVANLVLLIVGIAKGSTDGMGTLHTGTVTEIARLSTAYHVLINVLSTGLLTSSNYCMQLICAPSREDIDLAHAEGEYFDIGILSLRNVRRIPRYRAILWMLLAVSSIPLHLLYNSAIFSVTVGQDYEVTFFNASDSGLVSRMDGTHHRLENSEWTKIYDTKFVPDYGRLALAIDAVSFEIEINPQNLTQNPTQNLTWHYRVPSSGADYTWREIDLLSADNKSWDVNFTLKLDNPNGKAGNVQSVFSTTDRRSFPIGEYSPDRLPKLTWPDTRLINVSNRGSWKEVLSLNQDAWMDPLWHIGYAFAESKRAKSSVQISIPFIIVILVCNAVKTVAIYCTLRGSYSSQIITQGDAIATFLQRPDWSTIGLCTADKKTVISAVQRSEKPDPEPWAYRQQRYSERARGRLISYHVLGIIVASSAVGIIAVTLKGLSPWGTASSYRLPVHTSGFSAQGILFTSWLANSPQIILSLCYLAANRICTSLCFTHEWNNQARSRRGLRVTQPCSLSQRSAFFLQLPYRWAIPLTAGSGLLHWLLSQTLFLVRLEMRDLQGDFKRGSTTCACGYSMLSLLVFLICFGVMALVILVLMLRPITYLMPPADHCSLVISAACHPPPEDEDAQLGHVQWGVIPTIFGGVVEHCSFSGKTVEPPGEGALYA